MYTITDVISMHEWIVESFEGHPLFERLTDQELAADPLIEHLYETTEEGQKVRSQKRREASSCGGGQDDELEGEEGEGGEGGEEERWQER